MRLASWNVNSISVRMPHVLSWLQTASPDVLCIQGTKRSAENLEFVNPQRAGRWFPEVSI